LSPFPPAALGELVSGLGVTARVLVIGAHPDDEDTRLITWLQRGKHVETAYLSLTRGDGGQNLIGNELGEALGVIRTEELLAARRVDGAKQYFARAYDYGFSKNADEAFRHWPRDSLLRDMVTVVRAFRPHVIVAIFSGTPRDGHGQHQASGILAREVYDAAADTAKYPSAMFGPAWTVLKFYRGAGFNQSTATLRFNVGEYSPLLGRGFAEIAAESRSQHKSQAFGSLQRKGVSMDAVRREASRVNEDTPPEQEKSILEGIDTTWTRLRAQLLDLRLMRAVTAVDSLVKAVADAKRSYDALDPTRVVAPLSRVVSFALRACVLSGTCDNACVNGHDACPDPAPDVDRSAGSAAYRAMAALAIASGVAVEATASRELVALGDSVQIEVTLYNRGKSPIELKNIVLSAMHFDGPARKDLASTPPVLPDSSRRWTMWVRGTVVSRPHWLAGPRVGDLFGEPAGNHSEDDETRDEAQIELRIAGHSTSVTAPLMYRYADPVKGEMNRPVAVAPAISVTLDRAAEYATAGAPIDRLVRVDLRPAGAHPRAARVTLRLPAGLTADSATRVVLLPDVMGRTSADDPAETTRPAASLSAPVRSVEFRVRGRLPAGRHQIMAVVESEGQRFTDGYLPIEYDHIRPQRLYRPAVLAVEAVDVKLPAGMSVGYIAGVGDNIAPMLQQLGIAITMIDPAKLPSTDLTRFTSIVVGPRAYEASPDLIAHNARLLDYVKNGGTMVVQYGQYEMQQPGMMPYPITLARPADRVTLEEAPVTILAPSSPLLSSPNAIGQNDFEGWIQDRTLYMPRTFDDHYVPVLAMSDPGEPTNNGAILAAAYGKGTYVYTTLAFFRQLPAGVPGPARLMVNLMAADQRATEVRPAKATP
jgi:LmbE family N-acetylglucosaminyl deacetylase